MWARVFADIGSSFGVYKGTGLQFYGNGVPIHCHFRDVSTPKPDSTKYTKNRFVSIDIYRGVGALFMYRKCHK